MTKYYPQDHPQIFFHCEPKADACDHDWSGWRDFATGGEQVCTKCGMGAVYHSLRYDELDRAAPSVIAPAPEVPGNG